MVSRPCSSQRVEVPAEAAADGPELRHALLQREEDARLAAPRAFDEELQADQRLARPGAALDDRGARPGRPPSEHLVERRRRRSVRGRPPRPARPSKSDRRPHARVEVHAVRWISKKCVPVTKSQPRSFRTSTSRTVVSSTRELRSRMMPSAMANSGSTVTSASVYSPTRMVVAPQLAMRTARSYTAARLFADIGQDVVDRLEAVDGHDGRLDCSRRARPPGRARSSAPTPRRVAPRSMNWTWPLSISDWSKNENTCR